MPGVALLVRPLDASPDESEIYTEHDQPVVAREIIVASVRQSDAAAALRSRFLFECECEAIAPIAARTSLPHLPSKFRFLSHHPATTPSPLPSKAYLRLPPPCQHTDLLAPALPVLVVPHDLQHTPVAVALRLAHPLPFPAHTQGTRIAEVSLSFCFLLSLVMAFSTWTVLPIAGSSISTLR